MAPRPSVPTPSSGAPRGTDVFIARQPILDASAHLLGYELLFRSSAEADHFSGAPEQATASVLTDAVCSFSLDLLTHGHLAFMNITRQVLIDGLPAALPASRVVPELLEDIVADDDVLAACRVLKEAGYAIALDDFVLSDANRELLPFADYVKIDLHQEKDAAAAVRAIVSARPARPAALIAERVETMEEFKAAKDAGFTHFQGYFFGKPVTQQTRRIPEGQLGYLRLMQAMRDPDLTLQQLEALIKSDASLCYRVLRTVNSAGFALRTEIDSIGQALVMLGRDPIRRWVTIWALASLARGSNSELLVMSIVRARLCELLGAAVGGESRASETFLVGICSLLDAIFATTMNDVVSQLPLAAPVRGALLGEDNPDRRVLDAVIAYERGDWQNWHTLALRAGLRPHDFATAQADALRWANDAHQQGATRPDQP